MEYLRKIRELLTTTFINLFIYPNDEMFDEDFRQILQILFCFGFYRPVPSTKRAIYGVVSFVLSFISYLLGLWKDVIESILEGDKQSIIICVAYFALGQSIVVQMVTFLTKKSQILSMITEVHSIHKGEKDEPIVTYRNKSSKVVKFYKIYLTIVVTVVAVICLCGFKIFKLAMPALYDLFAEGSLYYPLLATNFIHLYLIVFCLIVSDMLHILFMIRAGANLKILSEKLRHCTDSDDTKENEKTLIDCIKYHRKISE